MECKNEMKTQHGCVNDKQRTEPNNLRRALSTFTERFAGVPQSALTFTNNEERRAARAHQLEVERQRAMTVMFTRRNRYL